MEPKLINWDPQWGQLSEEAMRDVLHKEGYTVAKYRYESGTFYPTHAHGVDKKEAILTGSLKVSWAGGSVVLEPGQMIEIAAGLRHSARVLGAATVTSLDASKPAARKPAPYKPQV